MSALETLNPYLLKSPRPLIGAETIQLLLLREILDYTVLRTEETRELNSVSTPLSESDRTTVAKRVAFLGSKQKAAESRQMEYLLRSAAEQAGKGIPSGKNDEREDGAPMVEMGQGCTTMFPDEEGTERSTSHRLPPVH